MEYLPLGDLQSYLNNPLPESEARTITEQTLQGIDFMHRSKIAHRDLKPKACQPYLCLIMAV
jgi:serine/threonine protein kinase